MDKRNVAFICPKAALVNKSTIIIEDSPYVTDYNEFN